jgi:hypothetical protein
MKKLIISSCLMVFLFTSCKKNLPDVGGTNAERMANEWWVSLYQGGVDVYGGYHGKIATSNTAANSNEIWVTDFPSGSSGNIWGFKVKAQADLNNLTFTANQSVSDNPVYPVKVTITEGKIIPGAGRSKSGNVTDSIYMKIEFSDDAGTIYELKGHARTKFIEDEY